MERMLVVFGMGGHGHALEWDGAALDCGFTEHCLSYEELDVNAPPKARGPWIWTGTITTDARGADSDPDIIYRGEWRTLDANEQLRFLHGDDVFDTHRTLWDDHMETVTKAAISVVTLGSDAGLHTWLDAQSDEDCHMLCALAYVGRGDGPFDELYVKVEALTSPTRTVRHLLREKTAEALATYWDEALASAD